MPLKKPLTLDTPIKDFSRLHELQKQGLTKLGLETLKDLLYHFPSRYSDISEIKDISNISQGEHVTLYGKIRKLRTDKAHIKKIPLAKAELEDINGTIVSIVWFRQPYIAKMLKDGDLVKLSGSVQTRNGKHYISNPEYEKVPELPLSVGGSLWGDTGEHLDRFGFPVYPETKGVTSKWIYHTIDKILKLGIVDTIPDPVPPEVLKKYNLPTLRTALFWIHAPQKESDAQAARKRFAFEEIFLIQLHNMQDRLSREEKKSFILHTQEKDIEGFIKRFPFTLTDAQKKAISEAVRDMKSGKPMSRLLEGDVGSGKTAVAATLVYAATTSAPPENKYAHLQTAYMAPTEILAKQHFESFIQYFAYTGVSIGLMTGTECRKFPQKFVQLNQRIFQKVSFKNGFFQVTYQSLLVHIL